MPAHLRVVADANGRLLNGVVQASSRGRVVTSDPPERVPQLGAGASRQDGGTINARARAISSISWLIS